MRGWSGASPWVVVALLMGLVAAAPALSAPGSAGAPPAAAAGTSLPVGSPSEADLARQMDALLAPVYPADGPGAAVLVVRDGRTLLRKGYGLANVELGVPIRPEMSFRLGSITKQFTATAILLLAEQGKLSLDDEITRFLPSYPTAGRKITIRHLLTHTSGIANYTDLPSYEARTKEDLTLDQLVDTFRNEPMRFAPGERFEYDNSGYVLLGIIVEKASGTSYEQLLKEKIFEPLGMTHTGYGHNGRIFPGRVCGYAQAAGRLVNADYLSMTQPFAAGGLLSSVDDLALWDAALYTEKVLKAGSLAQMFTPYRLSSGESTGYGLGWAVTDEGGLVFQEHGGGINGFLTSVSRVPSKHVFVALLGNSTNPELAPEFLARNLSAMAAGRPYKVRAAIKADPAVLEAYVGSYRIDAQGVRTVTRDGDRLFTQRTGGPRFEALASSEAEFFYKGTFNHFTFEKDAGGKVTGMTMYQQGQKLFCPRVEVPAAAPSAPAG